MEAALALPHLPRPELLRLERVALFLDLDGTLAAIEARPDAVGPDPRRTDLLQRLGEALGGRLAVISGRPLEDIARIVEGAAPAMAGIHGLERQGPEGGVVRAEPPSGLELARQMLGECLPQDEGLLIEDKGLALAVHYRQAPERSQEVRLATQRIAARCGLAIQPGEMVVELRAPGHDKGDAIAAFMAEAPFAGATAVFVGDDLTDENGFRAARDLGGWGVLVGPLRPTIASYRLEDVDEVLDWLESALTR